MSQEEKAKVNAAEATAETQPADAAQPVTDGVEAAEMPQTGAADTETAETAETAEDPALTAAKAEAAKAAEELARTKDLFLRTAAEYDNYRRRTAKEQEAAFGNGVMHAAKSILPLIDTLEMAAMAPTADENYKKGVTMTLEKAYAALKELGLEEIPAQDRPFDPQLHEAMMQQPVEGVEAGTVIQVFQKGYTLNGRVVRHACVIVSA